MSASVYQLHLDLLFLIRSSVHSTAINRKKKEGREEGKGRQEEERREETGRDEGGKETVMHLILDLPWPFPLCGDSLRVGVGAHVVVCAQLCGIQRSTLSVIP